MFISPGKTRTHRDLVEVAARWLNRRGCGAVLTEVGGKSVYGEIPDAIGWKLAQSFVIECKVSRSDFLADKKKVFRAKTANGMGVYRYYMVPKGLLRESDTADTGWGIIEVEHKKTKVLVQSRCFDRSLRAEHRLLYTALQRVQFRIAQPLHKIVAWQGEHAEVLAVADETERIENV